MKRYLVKYLEKWKNSANRKPLLLYGARQVGKTWLVRDFAAKNYDKLIELNFFTTESLKTIFDADISPEYIIRQLEIRFNTTIDPERTLLFFDEIQESQRAMDSLKSFNEPTGAVQRYHVIAAGSFLGVLTGRRPVGQTDHVTLYPMSFCEFLEACGHTMLAEEIQARNTAILVGAADILETLLKQYFYTGGMPAAVLEFITSGDFAKVRDIQNTLLMEYKGDFSKHIHDPRTAPKIRMLWDSIPMHLFKENKKFVYKNIKSGGRAAEFEEAMQWLADTGLIYKITRVETPRIPLAMHHREDYFKLYMLDIGLFCAKAEIGPADIFTPNVDLVDGMNGALAEQFVLQELKTAGISPIHYWAREGSGTAEVDFITQMHGNIIPMEVKSAKNTKAQSLKFYMNTYHPEYAIRTSLKNYGVMHNLYSIPLYMIAEFDKVLFSQRITRNSP